MSLLWVHATQHEHPTHESVQHILDNYCFDDAHPDLQHTPGRVAWQSVLDGYDHGWGGHKYLREDIAENGIKKPIAIDYSTTPPRVRNGHTRLMHAEALGLTHVPVQHTDAWDAHDDIEDDH